MWNELRILHERRTASNRSLSRACCKMTLILEMATTTDEAQRIASERIKAALAASKARGTKLGGFRGNAIVRAAAAASVVARQSKASDKARDLTPTIVALRSEGITSLRGIAKILTGRGIPTARGCLEWSPVQVSRLLALIRD